MLIITHVLMQCSRDAMHADGFTHADCCLIAHNASIWHWVHFVTIFYCCTFSINYMISEKLPNSDKIINIAVQIIFCMYNNNQLM